MSRRVFNPKSRKEQLQQQLLVLIRVIRRQLDEDVLAAAQKVAMELQYGKADTSETARYTGNKIPYDKQNARKAVAGFMNLKKDDPEITARILRALEQSD